MCCIGDTVQRALYGEHSALYGSTVHCMGVPCSNNWWDYTACVVVLSAEWWCCWGVSGGVSEGVSKGGGGCVVVVGE